MMSEDTNNTGVLTDGGTSSDSDGEMTRINPQVPADKVERFRELVQTRHGKIRAVYGQEIGNALALLADVWELGLEAGEAREILRDHNNRQELEDKLEKMDAKLDTLQMLAHQQDEIGDSDTDRR